MKSSDLRIGNFILSKDMPVQIEEIKPETIRYCFGEFPISYIEPIPLTEEWLLKFGFELYDYEPSEEEGDFIFKDYKKSLDGKTFYYTICECPYNEWHFGIKLTWAEQALLSRIKYVHQLQNLYFALTGEELEIK